MSYDIRFRKHVLKTRELEGLGFAKLAKRFGISKQTIYNWSKRSEEKKKRNKLPTKIDMEALKKDVKNYPDAFQYERADRFGVTQMGIWHALKRLGVTYKKNSKSPQSRFRKKIYILPKN